MEISSSTDELEAMLGQNIKQLRLQKNLDRQTLAAQAGVSLSALKHLETGSGATTKTLLRIVRALGRQDWIATIAPAASINPLHMVRDKEQRQRARRSKRTDGDDKI